MRSRSYSASPSSIAAIVVTVPASPTSVAASAHARDLAVDVGKVVADDRDRLADSSSGAGGSDVQALLGDADAARCRSRSGPRAGRADDELGRPATDVDDEIGRGLVAGRRSHPGTRARLPRRRSAARGRSRGSRPPARRTRRGSPRPGPRSSPSPGRAPRRSSSRTSRYSRSASSVRAIASGWRRRAPSTPCPSRVIRMRRSSDRNEPSAAFPVEVGDQESGRVRADVDRAQPLGHGCSARASCASTHRPTGSSPPARK